MKFKQGSIYLLLFMFVLLYGCKEESPRDREAQRLEDLEEVDEIQEIIDEGVLRAVVEYNSTDYFIYRGLPMGFEYELLSRIAKDLDVALHVVVANNLGEAYELLQSGEVNVVARGLTVTQQRRELALFTVPIFTTRQMLVQRNASRNDSVSSAPFVENVMDLVGQEVVVGQYTSYWTRMMSLNDELGG